VDKLHLKLVNVRQIHLRQKSLVILTTYFWYKTPQNR